MTEIELKKLLQQYLTTETGYSWYADSVPRCFVNFFEGEATATGDHIQSKKSPMFVRFELGVITTGTVLDLVDDSILSVKNQIDTSMRKIHKDGIGNPGKGRSFVFISWKKNIETASTTDTNILLQGNLSMLYTTYFPGL